MRNHNHIYLLLVAPEYQRRGIAKELFLRALSLLTSLPPQPLVLDIGCGTGASTIELAKQTQGNVIAIDSHQPFLETLKQQALEEGVAKHISAINASMFALEFEPKTFDVIWAEGAIYIIGFEQGLRAWRSLLKPNGYLVVSELSWLRPQPFKKHASLSQGEAFG